MVAAAREPTPRYKGGKGSRRISWARFGISQGTAVGSRDHFFATIAANGVGRRFRFVFWFLGCVGFFVVRLFLVGFFFFRLFFGGLFGFGDQIFFLFFQAGAIGDVLFSVEQYAALDHGFLGDRISAERIVIVDDHVGIFAEGDRA